MRSYYLLFIINVLIATGHAADGPSLTGEEYLGKNHIHQDNTLTPCNVGFPCVGYHNTGYDANSYRACPYMAIIHVNKDQSDRVIPDTLKTSLNGKTINTFFVIQNRYDNSGEIPSPLSMAYHPWVAQYKGDNKSFDVTVKMGLFDTEGIQTTDLPDNPVPFGKLQALQVNFHTPKDRALSSGYCSTNTHYYSPNNARFSLSDKKVIRFISAATYDNHAIILFHLLINDHDIAKEVLDLINYSNMTNNKIGNLITGLDNYSLDDETDKNSILWWTKKLTTATDIAACT